MEGKKKMKPKDKCFFFSNHIVQVEKPWVCVLREQGERVPQWSRKQEARFQSSFLQDWNRFHVDQCVVTPCSGTRRCGGMDECPLTLIYNEKDPALNCRWFRCDLSWTFFKHISGKGDPSNKSKILRERHACFKLSYVIKSHQNTPKGP